MVIVLVWCPCYLGSFAINDTANTDVDTSKNYKVGIGEIPELSGYALGIVRIVRTLSGNLPGNCLSIVVDFFDNVW